MNALEKPRVKRTWQQLLHCNCFLSTIEVGQNDGCILAELPNDLTASSAGRRQRFGVSNNGQLSKLSFAFGECFPDRDSLGTNRETITRALHIAAGVDLPAFSSYRGTNEKI